MEAVKYLYGKPGGLLLQQTVSEEKVMTTAGWEQDTNSYVFVLSATISCHSDLTLFYCPLTFAATNMY